MFGWELLERIPCEKLQIDCDELFKLLSGVKDWNTLLCKIFEHLLSKNKSFRTGKLDRGRAMLALVKEMQRRGISPEGGWDIQGLIKDFNKLARNKISGWSSRHSAEVLNSFFKAMGLESRLIKRGNTWDVRVKDIKGQEYVEVEKQEEEKGTLTERQALWTISMREVNIEVPKIEQEYEKIKQEYKDALSKLSDMKFEFVSRTRAKTKETLEEVLKEEDMPSIILRPRR